MKKHFLCAEKSSAESLNKHFPDLDCGYLRRLLLYDFTHNDLQEGDEFGLFDIDGELLFTGPTIEYIYSELEEVGDYCEIYLVH